MFPTFDLLSRDDYIDIGLGTNDAAVQWYRAYHLNRNPKIFMHCGAEMKPQILATASWILSGFRMTFLSVYL
jgi:hypothetical protein